MFFACFPASHLQVGFYRRLLPCPPSEYGEAKGFSLDCLKNAIAAAFAPTSREAVFCDSHLISESGVCSLHLLCLICDLFFLLKKNAAFLSSFGHGTIFREKYSSRRFLIFGTVEDLVMEPFRVRGVRKRYTRTDFWHRKKRAKNGSVWNVWTWDRPPELQVLHRNMSKPWHNVNYNDWSVKPKYYMIYDIIINHHQ